ncbi:MAG: tryptophan--tRNA ligase [Euryarchaeota archaeon]|nr:tryptophan--tRNA ligase [Euryarchaeota archaeon]
MKIDPWSSTTYQDYTRLRDEFGIQEFTDVFWKDLPHPHRLLRRGVIFGHRGFEIIHSAIKNKRPWAILTGLMPSGRMHLGHKMVIDEVMYYQSLGADIFIAVADIEAYATRGFSLEEARICALNEYISNYIALGLKPDRCHIYFQSEHQVVKDLAFLLGRKVNWSQMLATYGFTGSTNMSHIFSPLVQTGDILHVQLQKYGGVRPTLVPVGVDQDPHIRLSRDIAQAYRLFNVTVTKDNKIGVFVKIDENVDVLLDHAEKILHLLHFTDLKRISEYKALYVNDATEQDISMIDQQLAQTEPTFKGYGFLQPCSTYHRFITGLTGDKMSSSKPESAIFLTDMPKEAAKKIMQAKTGGAVSLEEQKRCGGKPDECMIYELFLYHLIEDDKELETIFQSCKQGTQMCGNCKKHAALLMEHFLVDLKEKREKAAERYNEYFK